MKITSVKSVTANNVSKDTHADSSRNFVFVKIETDEGITGWGESTIGPKAVATLIDEFGSLLVGEDPHQIEKHWQKLYHYQHSLRGGAIQMSAISGIEIALWDIKGQVEEKPIYELLSDTYTDDFGIYASGGSVSFSTDDIKKDINDILLQGFNSYKMRVGVKDWREDKERVRIAREELDSNNLISHCKLTTISLPKSK